MFSKFSFVLLLSGYALAQDNCTTTCQSFGVDFVDGGSYFQNIASTDPFTAVQEFEGCQQGAESNNILVDPSGDQYECSMSPLTPDDTKQTVTCPIDKNQLTSGEWSLIIISNNGQCEPIDYIRQFSLSVGQQSTVTAVPTVTLTTTSTPVSSTTITKSTTVTSSAPPSTTTKTGAASATFTIFPPPTFTIVTRGVFTLTSTSQVAQVVATSTVKTTGPCFANAMAQQTPSARRQIPDRVNNQISVSASPSPKARRNGGSTFSKVIRREVVKRAPDQPTTTIVNSSAAPSTTTSTIVAATSTVTGTTTVVRTSTVTPTVTVSKSGARVTSVTAKQVTFANTFWIPVTEVVVTRTSQVTATVTRSVSC